MWEVSFLVGAFRVSLWWGLGCLFMAPVTLVFLLVHWKVALRPFLLSLAGLGAALVGYYCLGGRIYSVAATPTLLSLRVFANSPEQCPPARLPPPSRSRPPSPGPG